MFTTHQAFASNLDDAWIAFNNNDRAKSKTLFTQSLSNPKEKAEAYLGLSFIAFKEGKSKDAFQNFKSFYGVSEDPFPYLYALGYSGILDEMQGKMSDEARDLAKKMYKIQEQTVQ